MIRPNKTPEVLAPVGSEECLAAAIENGADAVYFGLKSFSARARAQNFEEDALSRAMDTLRRRGVKGYVALNTLLFTKELPQAEEAIRACARAGVDALIVQDLGVARLARAIAPALPLHASTQMTVTSAEGVELVKSFGVERVILARELSLPEIIAIRQSTEVELEVFVHGALCVAYSGQCLTSEAWGGRSANRGECAQACRQPYTMLADGEEVDTHRRHYLLSPKDLQAAPLVPELCQAGVSALKIEGRLKSPEYVANATAFYRRAVDQALASGERISPEEERALAQPFSRGASLGFLGGVDHQTLVEGKSPSNRGTLLGTLLDVSGGEARVSLVAPVARGDGVVFEGDDYEAGYEGGRVFDIRGGAREGSGAPGEVVSLLFGRPGPDWQKVPRGCRVFKSDDPKLARRLRQSFSSPRPARRAPLTFSLFGEVGQPLQVEAEDDRGNRVRASSQMALAPAQRHPLDEALARAQLGRLGDVPYSLRSLRFRVAPGSILPVRELNRLRRELVDKIDEARRRNPHYAVLEEPVLPQLLARARVAEARETPTPPPRLTVVCRSSEQVKAALAAGADTIVIDFQDFVGARKTLEDARGKGATVVLATPRIQKPDELPLHRNIASWEPDAILVRSLGALRFFRELPACPPLWGDFSLNAANPLSAEVLFGLGITVLVPSYDLDREELLALAAPYGPRLEVTVHQHMPLFHMEHCVFAAFLSQGKDWRDCGRPCEKVSVALKDPIGQRHPVVADVGCRNTVFSGQAQSAAALIPALREAGVSRFRLEMAHEDPEQVARLLQIYREVLEEKREAASLWKTLRAKNQVGTIKSRG